MSAEKLLKAVRELIAKRPPRLIAGAFFSVGMFITWANFLTKGSSRVLVVHLCAAFAVSLFALLLRWVEKISPDPRQR
jgi:hypothetical protein